MTKTIRFKLNGQMKRFTVDRKRMLLWVLRTDFALAGTKYGCGAQRRIVQAVQTAAEEMGGGRRR
jgi:aerobic-type carbon monoxide dehydrogenase small subunit (CoxS/CutS family)